MFTHARYLRVLMSSEDRRKGILTVLTLLMLNASCLMAAWALLHTKSLVFTAALMAYLLGLGHAFDADHIAAIDNATRKLLEQETRPLFVGLYFSLGHATVVLGVCALLLATGGSGPRAPWVDRTRRRASQHGLLGGVAFHLAASDSLILMRLLRAPGENGLHDQNWLKPRGVRGRLVKALQRGISKSWPMYPVGVAVIAAIVIGTLELASATPRAGCLATLASTSNENFSLVGALIAITLLGGWLVAWSFERRRQQKAMHGAS